MSDQQFSAPARGLESAIAHIWQDLLGAERIAPEDDFFELGGESLEAVRMLATVEEVLLAQVSFADFLDEPTVAALAEAVQRARAASVGTAGLVGSAGAPAAADGAPAASAEDAAPCTYAQERLWFVEQMTGGTGAYNEHRGMRLHGPVDVAALERALNEIIARHAALRTRFVAGDDGPMAVVSPEAPLRIARVDVSDRTDPEAEARQLIDALASEPFDLGHAPLIRALLVRVGLEEHILELVLHHIVCDGWSHVVVLDELARLYEAYASGASVELPAPRSQYPDHARDERAELRGAALDAAVAPWIERLAGAPTALELVTDRYRPDVPSYRGATYRVLVPGAVAAEVREFARHARATPFATVLAAYYALLQRYSGQDDIVVGATTSGRDRPELDDAVGLFASTVALRCELGDRPTFRELVGRARETALWAVAHEQAPFDQVVARLDLPRDLSRHPIFQVFIAHVAQVPLLDGLAERYDAYPKTSRFDITLFVEEMGDEQLALAWEYSTDLFEAATIESLCGQFLRLVDAALAEPDRPVQELGIAMDTQTAAAAFPVTCMHELFEARVAEAPDAPALSYMGETLSYSELNVRANRLAHHLQALGAGPETMIALYLAPSVEMVVSILGVLKAGAAYVPLDPVYPAERVGFVLEDTGAPLVVTQDALAERLPASDARAVRLDGDAAAIAACPPENPQAPTTPENLAYVIYTSGSTGRPKGVQVEHRQVARLFTATDAWYGFGPGDTWPLLHSYAFDFSVWEIWGALAFGGRLVIVPRWTTSSADALAELVASERVTVMNATPSLFAVVQDELLRRAHRLALRYLVFGGEALQPLALRPWFERFGDAGPTLVNMYGITETTVHVTYRPLTAADCTRDTSPIGVPIPDLTLHLLDAAGNPVPAGVPGELFVGGAGVARGYLNRPELNAERFIANPFGPGRLYRTGDVARRLPDGELDFRGRIDDQVKIRGFRIELGEIQTVLREAPGVADCAVVATEAMPGDLRLAAYVVPHEERAGPVRRVARLEREGHLRPEQLLELPDGTAVVHINRAETEFSYGELFERGSCLEDGIGLAEGACVFDVGANIGMFALLVARRVPGARVFAFEPMPEVNEAMRLNAEIHGLDMVTFDCALGAERGVTTFTYFPHITIISGQDVDPKAGEAVLRQVVGGGGDGPSRDAAPVAELVHDRLEHVRVERPVRTVSDVIREHDVQRIDLLKVDVEGGELEVLAGVAAADWARIEQVFVEVHGGPDRLRLVREMLERAGFALSVEQDDALLEVSGRYDVVAVRVPVVAAPPPPVPEWRGPQGLRDALRAHLEQRLPEYMVPAAIVFMDRLPLTRNGKTDREALPAPVWETRAEEGFAAPATSTEHIIADVWRSVLGVSEVGRRDNFFDLGGHSLLAARVVTQVRHRCAVQLSIRALFDQPTLSGFATAVDALRPEAAPELEAETAAEAEPAAEPEAAAEPQRASGAEPEPAPPPQAEHDYPLSFQQQQLVFFEALEPGSVTYNAALALRIVGELDVVALQRALNAVIERHEALRTVLLWDEASGRQRLLDRWSSDVELVDLRPVPEPQRDGELRSLLRERARRPFDLSADLMLRTTVFRLGTNEHVLLFQTHHVAFDGWAVEVFYRDMGELYGAEVQRRPARLPALTLRYGEFPQRQRDRLRGERLERELEFWRAQLGGAPTVLRLPTDKPRPPVQTYDGAVHTRRLGGELSAAVRATCHEHRVTPYMLLLAAMATLLYRRTGQDDILFGGPMANRDEPGLEHLVGFFANTVVVRVKLAGNPTFAELLNTVRESVLASVEHQEVPLDLVVDAVRPQRVPGVNPLFQVNFRVRVGEPPVLTLPGATTAIEPVDLGLARFDLAVEMTVGEDDIEVEWGWNTDLFEPATILALADGFDRLLGQALAKPDTRLLSLDSDAPVQAPAPAGGIRSVRRARG